MLLEILQNPDLIPVEPIQAIAPLVAAAIISGLAAAGSATASAVTNRNATKRANATNLDATRQTNETNLRLAREQNEWNLEQWQREMDWQSPEHQVEQMTDAGMSSAGAVQALNPLSANSLQSAELANQVAPQPVQPVGLDLNGLPSLLGLLREVAALRKDNADAFMKEKDADLHEDILLTDLDVKKADLNLKKQNFEQFAESFPYTMRSLRYKAEADSRLPALRDLDIKNAQVNYDLATENVKLARQQFGFLEKKNDKEIEAMTEQIKNLIKQGREIDTRSAANVAAANASNAQAALLGEETEGQKLENKGKKSENIIKGVQSILVANGMPDSYADRAAVLIGTGVIPEQNLDVTFKGLHNFVVKGRNSLYVDPATRQFLEYYWDKGSANANRHGSSWLTDLDNLLGTKAVY